MKKNINSYVDAKTSKIKNYFNNSEKISLNETRGFTVNDFGTDKKISDYFTDLKDIFTETSLTSNRFKLCDDSNKPGIPANERVNYRGWDLMLWGGGVSSTWNRLGRVHQCQIKTVYTNVIKPTAPPGTQDTLEWDDPKLIDEYKIIYDSYRGAGNCPDTNSPNCLDTIDDYCKTTVYYEKLLRGSCIDPDDSMDWLVLQDGLERAENGKTLELPELPGNKTFQINQTLIVRSGSKITWLGGENASSITHVYKPYSQNLVGAMIAFQTLYAKTPTSIHSDSSTFGAGNYEFIEASNIWFDNPRVDGGDSSQLDQRGVNAIGIARGVKDLLISQGHISGIMSHPIVNGGKAIGCEIACYDVFIESLKITNSSYGINLGAFPESHTSKEIANVDSPETSVFAKNLYFENVDVPMNASVFRKEGYGEQTIGSITNKKTALEALDSLPNGGQLLYINGFEAHNSGAFERLSPSVNGSSIRTPSSSAGLIISSDCMPTVGLNYQDLHEDLNTVYASGSFYGPSNSGIIHSHVGENIFIENGAIENTPEYPVISGIFKSGASANVKIKNISFKGRATALINHSSGFNGLVNGGSVKSLHFSAENISVASGSEITSELVRFPADKEFRKNSRGGCVEYDSPERINGVEYKNFTLPPDQQSVPFSNTFFDLFNVNPDFVMTKE